jgi:hypothetical protein
MTQCFGQTDSNKVCLTFPQFDFYAQNVVENKGLKIDTAIMAYQIIALDQVVQYKTSQLINMNKIVTNKDSIINNYIDYSNKVTLLYNKELKKNKRLKTTSLILATTTFLLGILVIIK